MSWGAGAFEGGYAIMEATLPGDFAQVEELTLPFFDFLDESAAEPGLAPSLELPPDVTPLRIYQQNGVVLLMAADTSNVQQLY